MILCPICIKITLESVSKLLYSYSSFVDLPSLGSRCRDVKLMKTFHRSTMMDESPKLLSMITIKRACVQDLNLNLTIGLNVLAVEKARRKSF